MNKIFTAALAMLLTGTAAMRADAPWSLQQCVDYALSHNISIKSALNQIDQAEVDVTSAKDAFLPTVTGSADQSFSFGRGLTAENTYANRNTSNFNWGVGLSLPLFQGLSDVRQLKVARGQYRRYLLEHEAAKEDVTLNIIAQYLQVLYSREVLESAKSQLEYSTFEVERQQALVSAGKVAEASLYDAEAQQAQDRLQVVTAENDVHVALVNLANLLQLPTADNFDVLPLEEEEPLIPGPDVVYSRARAISSSILSARQGVAVAGDNVSLAKTGWIPKLSFSASIGSNYYTVSGMDGDSFGAQMRNNFSTYVGFRLSVPIFDGFNTRNAVHRARLQQTAAALELDRRESNLYQSIQLAYTQATGARDRYQTSGVTLEKTQLSFDAVKEKYDLGRATPTEFEQAKNNLFRVQVSRIQSRYEYLLRYRILKYYESHTL